MNEHEVPAAIERMLWRLIGVIEEWRYILLIQHSLTTKMLSVSDNGI